MRAPAALILHAQLSLLSPSTDPRRRLWHPAAPVAVRRAREHCDTSDEKMQFARQSGPSPHRLASRSPLR